MPITLEFAQLFSSFMDRAGYTDTYLARETGIVRQTIFRWKQAGSKFTPRRNSILRCAQVLKLSEKECNELLTATQLDKLTKTEAEYLQTEVKYLQIEGKKLTSSFFEGLISPFIIGMPVPIEKFFGRRYEIDYIAEILSQPPIQNIFITGARTVGKTSLLHYLHYIKYEKGEVKRNDRHFQSIPMALVDFQDVRMQKQTNILAHILRELSLPLPEVDSGPVDLYWFMDAVDQLIAPAIVLLDEIEAGIQAPDLSIAFWNCLRSVSQRFHQNKISFIISSSYSPLALTELSDQSDKSSPFFNTFGHIISLGPWNHSESKMCINSSPKPFSEEDQQWILEQSKGWPILVQLLCDLRLKAQPHWRELALQRLGNYRYLLGKDEDK